MADLLRDQDPRGFNVNLKNFQDSRAFPEEPQLMAQCSKTFRVSPCEIPESRQVKTV